MDKTLSPDELDRLMRVTSPRGWLALIALLALVAAAVAWGVFGTIPVVMSGNSGILLGGDSRHQIVSQTSGLVTGVEVKTGDTIKEGQVVARVRSNSGTESDVLSLFGGRVDSVIIEKGMLVRRGQNVAVVKTGKKPLEAFIFVPAEQGKQIKEGMKVQVLPSTVKAEEYGYIAGKVTSVSQFPVTRDEMFLLLENQSLVDTLRTKDAQVRVDVELRKDPSTTSGFEWSSSKGPPFTITRGTLCTANFVLGEDRPINLVLPTSG
jgi:multidrug resistance efflux pump